MRDDLVVDALVEGGRVYKFVCFCIDKLRRLRKSGRLRQPLRVITIEEGRGNGRRGFFVGLNAASPNLEAQKRRALRGLMDAVVCDATRGNAAKSALLNRGILRIETYKDNYRRRGLRAK